MRKLIIRIDDVGFTDVCNIGAFETIEHGFATSADVMLDCPGTVDALERLKKYPWISVGWHSHMWGSPVLPAERVPSLVEQEGPFAGRFREDLLTAKDVVPEEAVQEFRAQIGRCLEILGRAPDTGTRHPLVSPARQAIAQVLEEYGIACNFAVKKGMDKRMAEKIRTARENGEEWAQYYQIPGEKAADGVKRVEITAAAAAGKAVRDAGTPAAAAGGTSAAAAGEMPDAADREAPAGQLPDARWRDRKIIVGSPTAAYWDLYTDSISEVEEKYDPVLYYTEDRDGILQYPEDTIFEQSWHPGYVDYFVYRLGERMNRPRARQFVIGRTQDVAALCDPRLHDWLKENRIELVNFRDALYGTREYQNHLRNTGSDLYMG